MNQPAPISLNRRPVKSRSIRIFHRTAAFLVNLGITPNQVSVLSSVFAAFGALNLVAASKEGLLSLRLLFLFFALLGIQLRLICNLLDGLMAMEGGKKTAYGEFFNDFPDRISDLFLILAAGYSAQAGQSMIMPWIAAILSLLTAYIRVLGGSMGAPQFFLGPMAKQQRMAVLNLAIIGAAVELCIWGSMRFCLQIAIYAIATGAFITCLRRISAILEHFRVRKT